jgi:hypothetical protein
MAFFVLLVKESEDDHQVVYRFGPQEDGFGRLILNRDSGHVVQLEPCKSEQAQAFFTRAAVKVRQHWREGHFPNESCWAS